LEPQPVEHPIPDVPAGANEDAPIHHDVARGATRPTSTAKIFPRTPPIRFRKSVPDCWIGLELIEGKNRQVRRMTAAVGHPTLRLLRVRVGNFWLGDLPPGQWRILTAAEIALVSGSENTKKDF
jgi:pseudouridine synthase